jgi:hypothetical protein
MVSGRLSVSVLGAFAVSAGYVLFTSVSLVSGQIADQGAARRVYPAPPTRCLASLWHYRGIQPLAPD